MDTKPIAPSKAEWREIVKVKGIRQMWGLETIGDEAAFINGRFVAKFDYMSDGPGYSGDLFVILGGEPECPPIILIRSKKGVLEIADSTDY